MRTKVIGLGIIALCVVVGTALAADVTVGTWKVNIAQSKYIPGPAPKAQTLKIETMGANMKITIDATDAEGKATHSEWVGMYDGKDYAVKGDASADMRSIKKIDDNTTETVTKKAGKVTLTSKTVYSKDGKGRTTTQTGTNTQGQKVNNTVVYDKQ